MNIFFDVDETILGYDGSLRPLVREVFQLLVDEGHRLFIWSGVRSAEQVRSEVVEPYGLHAYVTDCYRKPLFDYREAWLGTGVEVQPDFCVDDFPGIVDAFGGVQVRSYYRAQHDTELRRVYEAIQAATPNSPGHLSSAAVQMLRTSS